MQAKRVLLLGFGNPGRGDDGLGPALAEAVGALVPERVRVLVDYQLAPEFAQDLAEVDVVFFLDATVDPGRAPYHLERVVPEDGLDFSSHALTPGGVLGLTHQLFGADPEAWLLTVAGDCFDPFVEGLSVRAQRHLEQARDFLLRALEAPSEAV